MSPEHKIQNEIQIALSENGCRIFRANVGKVKKYGKLNQDTWKQDLKQGFEECMRVLKGNGVLLFKWNEEQIKTKEVFEVFGQQPILGDKRSKTRWSVFIK